MKDNMQALKNSTIKHPSLSPPRCWICKDHGMVFYSKIIYKVSYDFAYKCTCKLGQISSDRIPQVPTEYAEKTAKENYKSYLKILSQ